LVLQREQTDIVVRGHAYGRGEARCQIEIRVDHFERRIAVFGDRRLRSVDGALRFSAPAPFEKIALGWESAYGGVDLVTREEWGDPVAEELEEAGETVDPRFGLYAYPRNPFGKGYLLEA